MNKRLIIIALLLLVLGSMGVMALDTTSSSTCGFWGKRNQVTLS